MSHTMVGRQLRGLFSFGAEADRRRAEIDQAIADLPTRPEPHGRKLGRVSRLTAEPIVAVPTTKTIRIAVVGGGLAGLTCAYRLKQAGYLATIYEASDRVGGRSYTLRGAFEEGQLVERGGQLIDSGHSAIRRLIRDLGLALDDVSAAEVTGTTPCYWFDNSPYSHNQALEDLRPIWGVLQRDLDQAGGPSLHDGFTARGHELDNISVSEYVERNIPGGRGSKLGRLLEVAYTVEYGADSGNQSSLNMLYLLADQSIDDPNLYGASDERFVVHGGCDQVPTLLAGRLTGQIETGTALVAIRRRSDRRYALSVMTDMSTKDVIVDKVVLALPFSVLRSTVEFDRAGFRSLKQTAIHELGMGTNSKLHVQLTDRHWAGLACNGQTFSDRGYQATWDESRAQLGRHGILIDYTGGAIGAELGSETIPCRVHRFLRQIEPLLPGISGKWNGKATVDHWANNRWTKGSYSFRKVGQYTRFAGVEGEREDNCHFAGEHTSIDSQGYLNGAVESGERAANEVLQDIA